MSHIHPVSILSCDTSSVGIRCPGEIAPEKLQKTKTAARFNMRSERFQGDLVENRLGMKTREWLNGHRGLLMVKVTTSRQRADHRGAM